MPLHVDQEAASFIESLKCWLASLLGRVAHEVGGQIALQTALKFAVEAKGVDGITVTFTATDGAKQLAKNNTDGPMVVHVRANLDDGAAQPFLYLASTRGAAESDAQSPWRLADDQQDTFLLAPGQSLWGRIAGGAGTGSVPVSPIAVLGHLDMIRKVTQRKL